MSHSRASYRLPRSRVPAGAILRSAAGVVIALALAMLVNWLAQAARKPSEWLFPVSGRTKTPADTWRSYGPLFREYSTATLTPEFLAALAQAEAAGDPVAHTYWRWEFKGRPLDWYRPASTSVGLYQMTDGTFAQARRLCIIDHQVAEGGHPGATGPCRFSGLYSRIIPAHAVELTAAYLDRQTSASLLKSGVHATHRDVEHLAAVIHLCGASVGDAYARSGFRLRKFERCGAHDPRAYLERVDDLRRQFAAVSR